MLSKNSVLRASLHAFFLGFVPPVLLGLAFSFESMFLYPWTFIGIAFHEVGHLLFGSLASPFLTVVFPLSFLSEPIHYLGGFLFNCFLAVALLAFSLSMQSRIESGRISRRFRETVFSFMLLAYINLFTAVFTLVVLSPVVGPGRDFSVASSLLRVPLQQLIGWLWAVCLAVFVIVFFNNLYYVLRGKWG